MSNFYPRSPCGERPPITFRHCTTYLFLSTLSLRRATRHCIVCMILMRFLSTLSLRRATKWPGQKGPAKTAISIHALLAESDHPNMSDHPHNTRFLSTLSLRRATCYYCSSRPLKRFLSTLSLRRATYKNNIIIIDALFLSTLSLRRATNIPPDSVLIIDISIHALLAESDAFTLLPRLSILIFLSTLSLRRATGGEGEA